MRRSAGSREWRLAAHPVFLTFLIVLVANDQIGKQRWPGLVTGKLSDVAGVGVVSLALVVMGLGRTPALAATALGFTALKTIEPLAPLAAWALGGAVVRDVTDLAALGVLAPLWWWLGRRTDKEAAAGGVTPAPGRAWLRHAARPRQPTVFPSDGRRPLDRARRLLAGIAFAFAVLAATATSYAEPDVVTDLRVEDGAVLAEVNSWRRSWFRSEDALDVWVSGGDDTTWVDLNPDPQRSTPDEPPPGFPEEREPQNRACLRTGECFVVDPGRAIQQEVGGRLVDAYAYTQDDIERMNLADSKTYGTRGRVRPSFLAVTSAEVAGGELLLVANGVDGVVIRLPDGSYHRRSLRYAGPTPIGPPPWLVRVPAASFLAAVGSIVVSPALYWRRRRLRVLRVVLHILGSLGLIFAVLVVEFSVIRYWNAAYISLGLVALLLAVAVALYAIPDQRPAPEPEPMPPTGLV